MTSHVLCPFQDTEFALQLLHFFWLLIEFLYFKCYIGKKHTIFRKGKFHCKQTSLLESNLNSAKFQSKLYKN